MIKVQTREPAHETIFCLQGSIVTGETSRLSELVVSQSETEVVVLDLARVNRIDARGLGVLLELREQLLANSKEFKLRNVTMLVRQVLEITRLNSVFEISTGAEISSAVLLGHTRSAMGLAHCA